jgi:Zn-dependent protease
MGWWAVDFYNIFGQAFVVAWVIWALLSVTLHELAHGWVAERLGDPTPRALGHMTVNPLTHLGPLGIGFFVLCGLPCGAMPVDQSRLRGKFGVAQVAAAGPMMNAVLALICIVAAAIIIRNGAVGDPRVSVAMIDKVYAFAATGAMINTVLAIFNLLPVYPLDGGRVAMTFSRSYARLMEGEHGFLISLSLLLVLMFVLGGFIWGLGLVFSQVLINLLAGR